MKRIDRKYCGQDRCRFLLPVAITEQESKAQYHFRQLAFLSGKIKRTIVLPNVDSSHLGACRKQPFDFYYGDEWLKKNSGHFNYITMQQFKQWLHERHNVKAIPTGQEIFLEIDLNFPHLSKAVNCFKDQFDFTHRPRSHFPIDDPETVSRRSGNFTEMFINILKDETRQKEYLAQRLKDNSIVKNSKLNSELDVIHLYYDRRFGYIEEPQVEEPLTYHSRWSGIADSIAQQLQPFVAVHWRMERLEPLSNLKPCAESLLKKLTTLQQQHQDDNQVSYNDPIDDDYNQDDQDDNNDDEKKKALNVFLLTDYPHLLTSPLAKPESMSFKLSELHQEHHEAVRYLYQHVNVTLTTLNHSNIPYQDLPSENWNLIPVDPLAKPSDKSILGIVDKLVAIRAQWFLFGEASVCGKDSSFTRRIRMERQQHYRAGDQHIISPFDEFGL
ncbi:hypothetical protein BJ944DRAFT_258032 [Cunninghamella echinulata]|nr:hypothetical protein BJ944DRAFT_258032 [Cunninghamella echinulata]